MMRSSSSSSSSSSFTLLHLIAVFALTSRCSCATTDSLLPNQSLQDGETLVSANKTFELGFFSPGATSNRYVGVWYHRIPNRTVVWVANRNSPLVDTSGSLIINYDGDLMILDGKGSSITLADGSGSRDVKAAILDSGNFVLSESGNSSNILWQSFDDPTDTWLPGMKIGLFGRQNRLLTSWRSNDDPSPGDFSFGTDPKGAKQLFTWQNEKVYWTSGLSSLFQMQLPISNYSYEWVPGDSYEWVSRDNVIYCTYAVKDSATLSMFMIDSTGVVKLLLWDYSYQQWIMLWAEPGNFCDVYSACGAFGVCNLLAVPFCQCLEGFQPSSSADWNNGFTSGGCARTTSLQCENGGKNDKFLEMPNMTFPSNPQALNVGKDDDCESACLKSCSCTAYAVSKSCNLWHGDLVNLKEHTDITAGVGTIYIRLSASELESKALFSYTADKNHKRELLIIVITASLSLVIFCSILSLLWNRRQKFRGRNQLNGKQSILAFGTDEAVELWGTEERGSQFPLFEFSQIADATNNFSSENKLGEGGFGPVYKGLLLGGQDIAVKRLAAHSGQGLVEFKNEILLIAKLQHRNLVRLLGCCIQGEEKILVYEYMPNKSLDFFLFDKTARTLLDWRKRFNIIDGIAQGLLYLHKHSRLRIIHRDLKASNILLDEEMNPKISDFGMARIFGSNETQANTNRVVGTYGYMSPEYAMEGLFSVKSDVFSFGVLLLEIVSGLRNAGFHQYGNSLNLLGHAWELWKEGRWIELVDESLGEGCLEEVLRCIHVALMCVQENAVDRPTMSEVIAMLSSENASLPDPKQPAFITVRIAAETNTDGACSPNVVTVSIPEGR